MPFVEAFDGNKIYYVQEGDGEVCLVFISGLGGQILEWDYQKPLSSKFTIVLLDLSGHGKSSSERKAWTMVSYGRDVEAVVVSLNLRNVVFVGHSMGGAVMLEAAKLLGDRILGLIGIDTLWPGSPIFDAPQPEMKDEFFAPILQDAAAWLLQVVETFYSDKIDKQYWVRVVQAHTHFDPQVIIGSMEALWEWDLHDPLKELHLPIRCIAAGKTFPDPENREKYRSYFQTVFMEGLGHCLFWEEPEEFNRLLAEQVQSILSEKDSSN
jgi:pimeloyl-ACP methyl ester carboxylesterase